MTRLLAAGITAGAVAIVFVIVCVCLPVLLYWSIKHMLRPMFSYERGVPLDMVELKHGMEDIKPRRFNSEGSIREGE